MEAFNQALFLLINTSTQPNVALLTLAKIIADYVIWLAPLALASGWLRDSEPARRQLLQAAAAGLAGLLINQIIGLLSQHPRPFMIGLTHALIPHVADSSFPSDT